MSGRNQANQLPIRLVHITTVPQSLYAFFEGQIGYMVQKGIDVHAISTPGPFLDAFADRENIPVHPIEMPRAITPLRDIRTVLKLTELLHRLKPHVVHAHTPKGGLLGMLAACLSGVPVRIYHIHGLPYMTASGLKRTLLIWTERISCFLSNRVLCVSNSVRDVAIEKALCNSSKISTLLNGTINGIDSKEKFTPDKYDDAEKIALKRQYTINDDSMILGFVGRITKDKGIVELWQAWEVLRENYKNLELLIVGPREKKDPVPAEILEALTADSRVHLTGPLLDVSPAYSIMDVLVLPTHREGFGLVAVEAAAMNLPVVATDIPGCRDAVVDGVTGTLVPPLDAQTIAFAVKQYIDNPDLRERHAQAGRERVTRDFQPEGIWFSLYREYMEMLESRGIKVDVKGPLIAQ